MRVVIHHHGFAVSSWAGPGAALSRWVRVTMAIPHCELFHLTATFYCPLKPMMGFPDFPLMVLDLIYRLASQLADYCSGRSECECSRREEEVSDGCEVAVLRSSESIWVCLTEIWDAL